MNYDTSVSSYNLSQCDVICFWTNERSVPLAQVSKVHFKVQKSQEKKPFYKNKNPFYKDKGFPAFSSMPHHQLFLSSFDIAAYLLGYDRQCENGNTP